MSPDRLVDFRQIWFVDFEYQPVPGDLPSVICMVAREWRSGQTIRLWKDQLTNRTGPPFSQKSDCLYIPFFASAEFSCHLALNWPLPANVVDLYVENRNLTNGFHMLRGNGLLGALFHHGVSGIEHEEKTEMRDLAIRGGPWSDDERRKLLDYCESDVIALSKLFDRVFPKIDLPRALLRGRYMKAVARMEATGVPIDEEMHDLIMRNAEDIRTNLIRDLGAVYGVYEQGHFRHHLFEAYLKKMSIEWPRLPSSQLDLKDDTFSYMAMLYPKLKNLKILRSHLGQLQMKRLPLGYDGRNRCMLSPFASKTGRNQPRSTNFVFGRAKWIRRLITPPPGRALLYIDYEQQEFGIAAALSGDSVMQDAYNSDDPYLSFARQAGTAPENASKQTHKRIRDIYKACALAVQYGMGANSLAFRTGQKPVDAKALLNTHRRLYSDYWNWSENAVSYASLMGKIHTAFGWTLHVTHTTNPRTLQNFPMQANGAEILRLACCFLCEAGITVCAPIHDAVLVECAIDDIAETLHDSKLMLAKASRIVLGGFELRTGVQTIEYPRTLGGDDNDDIWRVIQTTVSR